MVKTIPETIFRYLHLVNSFAMFFPYFQNVFTIFLFLCNESAKRRLVKCYPDRRIYFYGVLQRPVPSIYKTTEKIKNMIFFNHIQCPCSLTEHQIPRKKLDFGEVNVHVS